MPPALVIQEAQENCISKSVFRHCPVFVTTTVKIRHAVGIRTVPSKSALRLLFTDFEDGVDVREIIRLPPSKYVFFPILVRQHP